MKALFSYWPWIVIGIALIVALNVVVPQLEEVGKMRAVSMSPNDAPAMIATKKVGAVFEEFDTSSSVMIVLEGEHDLGADAHTFYDKIVADLRADTTHIQHVQDFWGDSLPAAGAQRVRRRIRPRGSPRVRSPRWWENP